MSVASCLGTFIALEVARRLDHEFLRNDIIKAVARGYHVRETGVVLVLEARPRLWERLGDRSRRYRLYLEAAVLDVAGEMPVDAVETVRAETRFGGIDLHLQLGHERKP